jgi:DNA-binding MarR family transcriptional regulator
MVHAKELRKKNGQRPGAVPEEQATRFMAAIQGVFERDKPFEKEIVDALLDFSPPEMRSIMWLSRFGKAVMTDFAKGIQVPLSTATRIANRLVKKGHLVRRRSDLDRRIVEVDLSPLGYEYKGRFEEQHMRLCQNILSPLSPEERETMLSLMEKALRLSAPPADGAPNDVGQRASRT